MKRVRISIDPHGVAVPPIYEAMTDPGGPLSRVRIVNWNVSTPPAGFLLRFRGDYEAFEPALAAAEGVSDYAILPITDDECHCFLEGSAPAASRALFENFTRGSLMTVPPVECRPGGSSTFTLVGTEADIQAAVEGVPGGVDVTVEAVGRERVAPRGAVAALSPRQREAVEAALELGYYDEPRGATTADVAAALDCATATAAEHLRKAESTVFSALIGGDDGRSE